MNECPEGVYFTRGVRVIANSILTPQMLARAALSILKNENSFIKNVNRDRQAMFGAGRYDGQKAGSTIGIRLPNDYIPRNGNVAVPQSTNETKVQLVVSQQTGVDLAFPTTDLTLNIVDFTERYIKPAVNVIAGSIASTVIAGSDRIPNVIHNVDNNNNTIAPIFQTFARAGAILDNNSVPRDKRMVFVDPITMGNSVSSFAGLFNDQEKIAGQYRSGMITDKVIGMDWMMDQTVPKQTTATYGAATFSVNGAGQIGALLTITATTAPLNAGDKFTIAGVFGVNRINKNSNGQLRTFTVDAPFGTVFPTGTTQIPIYPALVPSLAAMNAQGNYYQPYQTVTASPANGAAVVPVFNSGETYRQNFLMHPEAVTLAIVPLEVPTGPGVIRSATETQDGISISLVTYWDGTNYQEITRMDVLYGFVWQRPEFACIIGDAL